MNKWVERRVLVTGGLGFIGFNLVKKLISLGSKVVIVDDLSKGSTNYLSEVKNYKNKNILFVKRDLSKELVKDIIRNESIDIVFHLAAKIGGIKYFHKYPATILRDNALITINVFESVCNSNVEKIIYFSSSMVYERSTVFPLSEDLLTKIPPPITSYGFSKLAGEYIAKAYNEEYGVKYVIVRPFNVYGPGELPGEEPGLAHVIPDLVKKVIEGQYPLEIFGTGEQSRSFTYISDLVDGVLLVAEKAVNDDYNIGNDEEVKIIDLARLIWNICERKEPFAVKHLQPFKYDVQRRMPDISKIKCLGWRPKVKLEEGLKYYIAWYKEYHKKFGK
jgi:nucleoside-diphosphate-sugar epimerase